MSEYKNHSMFLTVTAYCFEHLIKDILQRLEDNHPDILNEKLSQIYGFGGYDSTRASLKDDLHNLTGQSINGKYLYDKKREVSLGKPTIKINKPYNHILFEYLGYDNATSYFTKSIKDQKALSHQLELLQANKTSQDHYYVSYHFGEYKAIVKSEVIVKDNWKRIEYNYVYPQEDGSYKYFLYYGNIKKRADALHIQTRTFMDGKMVPAGENILYIGYGDPAKSKFLLGVFSAFDINNKLIAAKTINEKCGTKDEMIQKSHDKKVPGYIAQELRNQRIENDILIPNHKLELSAKSPYYLTYEKIAGNYQLTFTTEYGTSPELNISINPDDYKLTALDQGILINHDEIRLINNASILNIRLHLTGQTPFSHVDLYLKTYYLNTSSKEAEGIYSGVDFENRLDKGSVRIKFNPSVL